MDSVVEVPQDFAGRYTTTAQFLHWFTAVLMFTVLPLAWVMVSMKDNSPYRGLLFTLHKSVGLTILALAAMRMIWRAFYSARPLSDNGAHLALVTLFRYGRHAHQRLSTLCRRRTCRDVFRPIHRAWASKE